MRYSLTTSAILVASVSVLHAGGDETTWERNYLETARSYCAPQVEVLSQTSESTVNSLAKAEIEWDPEIDENQQRAFNKMAALAIVTSDQVAYFSAYANALVENQLVTEQLVNANGSLLDLVDCLWLSREERDLVEDLVLSTPADESGKGPSYSSVDFVLGPFDQAECMHWREASRRILEITVESEDVGTRLNEVMQDTFEQCEEDFDLPFQRKS